MSGPTSRAADPPGERLFPVFLSLGSNIEPAGNLRRAVALLAEGLEVRAVSRVYETDPVGASDTPTFFNAAVLVATGLAPRVLKHDVLRPLEARLGRVRTADRNAPRTIDVDLALYGALILEDPGAGLRIPDPDTLARAHVALPLADLSPDTRHPLTGETLAQIAARFAGTPGVRPRPDLRLR